MHINNILVRVYFLIISESDLVSRYGEFTITNRDYMDDLANSSSSKYKNMYAEVSEIVSVTYNIIKKFKHFKMSQISTKYRLLAWDTFSVQILYFILLIQLFSIISRMFVFYTV